MSGETDLGILLSSMDPELRDGEFVFCAVDGAVADSVTLSAAARPWAIVREDEAVTLILDRASADAAKLPYETVLRRITLNVHSSLDAVGLTAAVAGRLAEAGISANVVAAFYHDHVFVQAGKAEEAVDALRRLAKENSHNDEGRAMKAIKGTLIGMHFLVGVGGLAGGFAAVSNPVSPLGIPTEMLKNGPFTDYLIPGILLMVVIGMGNIAAAFLAIRKFKYAGLASGAMGAILVGWIVIQCYILQAVAALHVIFFLIGAAQGMLALASLWMTDGFPMGAVKKWLKRT